MLSCMNRIHRRYCKSEKWRDLMGGEILPWVLKDVEVSGPTLEIGPGPGIVTDALLRLDDIDLTMLEIDPQAAERLRYRYGSRVRVQTADAAAMPLPDDSFAVVVCCTMLHHVPTRQGQDRVLAESQRVLRPGGVLVGSDSRTSFRFRMFHLFDVHNPVDPVGLPDRLEAAGFRDVLVEAIKGRFRFRAVAH